MRAYTINAKLKSSSKWPVKSYPNTNPMNNPGFANHDMESTPSTSKNISNNQRISNNIKDDPNNNKINATFGPAHQDQAIDHHHEPTINSKTDPQVVQQHLMAPEDHHTTAIFAIAKAIAIDNV